MIDKVEALRASLSGPEPESLPPLVRALWLAARGDWDGAHAIAQDIDTRAGARVHAYLHRVEGDADNAAYWYRRAAQPVFAGSHVQEWEAIARALLANAED